MTSLCGIRHERHVLKLIIQESLGDLFLNLSLLNHILVCKWNVTAGLGMCRPRVGSGAVRIGPTPFPDRRS